MGVFDGPKVVRREADSDWRKVLVVMEGVYDIQFLKHAGRVLQSADSTLPDLSGLESAGRLLFLPVGGGAASTWVYRFAGLACLECHIFDKETMPQTPQREQATQLINQRLGCCAYLTRKRGIENYFHAAAIAEALGIDVDCDDDNDVAMDAARQFFEKSGCDTPWDVLSTDARRRQRDRAKKLIHTHALAHMTARRVRERDEAGEIRQWLMTIGSLADQLA